MSVVNTLSIGGARQVFQVGSSASPQRLQVNFVADVSSNTSGQFFVLSTTSTKYYVWNNVGSVGTNPTIPGYTSLPVVYAANSTAATIASAMAAAIAAIGGAGAFGVGKSNGSIFIENVTAGLPLEAPSLGSSLWTFGVWEPGLANSNGAGNGSVYLFTTPPNPDFTYKVVINTTLPSGVSTPLTATVAAPLIVGPNTPVYLPLVWSTSISGQAQIEWTASGSKIT